MKQRFLVNGGQRTSGGKFDDAEIVIDDDVVGREIDEIVVDPVAGPVRVHVSAVDVAAIEQSVGGQIYQLIKCCTRISEGRKINDKTKIPISAIVHIPLSIWRARFSIRKLL